jgi:hypothetical protein
MNSKSADWCLKVTKYNKNKATAPLADGVNTDARKLALTFRDADLMVLFDKAERLRRHGELTHFDEKGMPVMIFCFTDGVCMRCHPAEWGGKHNVFKGSELFYKA